MTETAHSKTPWEVESRRDSEMGDYFVIEREDGKVILDTFNSEVALIEEEYDCDDDGNSWRNRWDAQGKADLQFIVEAVNAHADHLRIVEALEQEIVKWKDKPAAILPRLVVCAVIIRNGKVLLERRAPSGVEGLDNMWDLPGGKVEPQETPEDAIVREIAEELSIGIRPSSLIPYLPTSTWKYADGEQRYWILAAYSCVIISGEPACTEILQWFDVNNLPHDILEADRRLIVISRRASTDGEQTEKETKA